MSLSAGAPSRPPFSESSPLPWFAFPLPKKNNSHTYVSLLSYQPYDEVRRLGLTKETEQRFRKSFPLETGMLAVEQVLPKGPADGLLEPGDILVEINGTLIARFIDMEEIFDSSVGSPIK